MDKTKVAKAFTVWGIQARNLSQVNVWPRLEPCLVILGCHDWVGGITSIW